MNTNELIKALQIADPTGTARVEIAVHISTKIYPVAYIPDMVVENRTGATRVYCWLPDGMHTVQKAAK